MTRIIVKSELLDALQNHGEPVEVCNETGEIVGQFIPKLDLDQYEPCEPPISEEELQRREKSDRWYTTEQVLAHLQSLEQH